MKKQSIQSFLDELSSNNLVPGGGSASSLVAAIGTSLGSTVGNLALGKKRYEQLWPEIERIVKKSEKLKKQLEDLIEEDARTCEPLLQAFKLPTSTPEEIAFKEIALESALEKACEVPLEIMKKTIDAIDLHDQLYNLEITTAISDIGVGLAFCKAALEGASLNVFINTKIMKNDSIKLKLNKEAEQLLKAGTHKATTIVSNVTKMLK